MTDEVEPREIEVPSILSDFEINDRVFFRQGNATTVFGSVTDVTENTLFIVQTGWPQESFAISVHGSGTDIRNSSVGQWRKMPDIFHLEVGDILSTTYPRYLSSGNSGREKFTIRKIGEFWERLILRSLVTGTQVVLDGDQGLDYFLQHWEVEG